MSRSPRLPQAAVVALGFVAGDMYDKESESESDLCVYVCGSGGCMSSRKKLA